MCATNATNAASAAGAKWGFWHQLGRHRVELRHVQRAVQRRRDYMADGELVFEFLQRADLAGGGCTAALQALAKEGLQTLAGPGVQGGGLLGLTTQLLDSGLHQVQQLRRQLTRTDFSQWF